MQILYLILFPIVYLGLDALHDFFVIMWSQLEGDNRKHYSWLWHTTDAIMKGSVALLVYYLWVVNPIIIEGNLYLFVGKWWLYFMAIRYAPFSITLNLLRHKKWNYSGKEWWDKLGGEYMIPQGILLVTSIGILIWI